MTHIEIEHEPMGLIIRADGIVGPDGCCDPGCYDIGTYVPDRSKPRGKDGLYPRKWLSFLEGLKLQERNTVCMNVTEAYAEELKTDIECKEEQGRE